MKKLVRVTIEKEIEIDIDDSCLTEEALKEFESYMFVLEDYDKNSKVECLFAYAARMCFEDDCMFIEGIGEARPDRYTKQTDTKVVFNVVDEQVETEVIDD